MEKKLYGIVLFLVILMTYEFTIMQIDARMCLAKSKKYRGRCYFGSHMRNCKTICKNKEGFTAGICKRGVCMCSKKCVTNLPITPPSDGGDVNNPGTGDVGNSPDAGDGNNPGGRVGNNTSDNPGGRVGNNTGDGDNNNPGGGDGNNPGGDVGTTPTFGGGITPGTGERTCMSRSKKFRGYCYLASHSRNCKTICKIKEGFTGGVCKRGICKCTGTCGTHSLLYNVVSVEKTFEGEEGEIDVESDNTYDVEKF